MSHLPTVWLKENQVRLVGSSRSFTCNYKNNRHQQRLAMTSNLVAMASNPLISDGLQPRSIEKRIDTNSD